ncbi:MAG: hypothetical protein IIA14_08615 [SAR324 cluster bacterium]|nr:hypothetical protein [SAR324 cluster bacterium]
MENLWKKNNQKIIFEVLERWAVEGARKFTFFRLSISRVAATFFFSACNGKDEESGDPSPPGRE